MFGITSTIAISTLALLQTSASGASLRRLEYEAIMSPQAGSCAIEYGFDYVGNDIGNALGAAEQCCDKCGAWNGCQAWSWSNFNGGTCWFKSAKGQVQANANVKSASYLPSYLPTCQVEQDVDIVGNDMGNQQSGHDGCCSICQTTAGCRAYSWSDLNGGTCWLKSAAGPKIYKAGVKSAAAYPVGYGECPIPVSGIDYVGNDIANTHSPTAEGCCDICKSFPTCRAYSWTNQNGGTCWLKSAKTGTIAKAGVTSAQVLANVQPSCSAVENDTDYIGNDIGNVGAGDSSQCCSLCAANNACKAWSWSNYNGGTCWLKSAKGQTTGKSGVKSAMLL